MAFRSELRKTDLCWQTPQKTPFTSLKKKKKASYLWSKLQSKGEGPERGMATFFYGLAYLGCESQKPLGTSWEGPTHHVGFLSRAMIVSPAATATNSLL